jgi:uncharacterized membrane protein YheB (UPF0754 family)
MNRVRGGVYRFGAPGVGTKSAVASVGGATTREVEHRTRRERAVIGAQPGDHGGDFFHLAKAAHGDFAQHEGDVLGRHLVKHIESKITDGSNLQQVMPIVETHIDNFLRNKLAAEMPIISMFIGDKTIEQLKSVFMKELEALFPVLMANYMDKLKHQLDLEAIVTEKVSNFSSDKLEEILQAIMSKEFRFIEVIGAVLGLLIGLIQVLITWIGQ